MADTFSWGRGALGCGGPRLVSPSCPRAACPARVSSALRALDRASTSPARRCRRAPPPRWLLAATSLPVSAPVPRRAWRCAARLRSRRHEAARRASVAPPPAACTRAGEDVAQDRGGEGSPSRPPFLAASAPAWCRHGPSVLWQGRQRRGRVATPATPSDPGGRRCWWAARRRWKRWRTSWRCSRGQRLWRRGRAQWRGIHRRRPAPAAPPWRLGVPSVPVRQLRL